MTPEPAVKSISRSPIRPLGRKRPLEVRLDSADFGWIAALALAGVICAVLVRFVAMPRFSVHLPVTAWGSVVGAIGAGLCAAMAFVLGRTLKDRSAGVAAGILTAGSVTGIAGLILSPSAAVAAVCVLVAMILMLRGQTLAAFIVAAVAAGFQPETAAVGLALLIGANALKQPSTSMGLAAFIVGILSVGAIHFFAKLPWGFSRHFESHGPLFALMVAAIGATVWFAVPLVTELVDKSGQARWTAPVAAVVLISMAAAFGTAGPFVLLAPILPLVWVLCSAGISRLMPSAVGDLPTPTWRYCVASIGMFLIVLVRLTTELSYLTVR